MLEEVFFRGALDTHVHDEREKRGVWSALFVSALWGVWHLPIREPGTPVWAAAAAMIVVHSIIGSRFRSSGAGAATSRCRRRLTHW